MDNWEKKEVASILTLPLLLIGFVIVFTKITVDLVTTIMVKPLLASIVKSTITIDVACLLIGAWAFWKFVHRAINGVRISLLLVSYITSFSIIFVYLRQYKPAPFVYVHFSIPFLSGRYLTDLFLLPFAGVICYYILYYGRSSRKGKRIEEDRRGFYTDEPIILNGESDLLKRQGYVLDLKGKILATKANNQSFAVAVIGKWGSGKTSFITTLENIFKSEPNVIQLKFNPWVTGGSENITSLFFNELAKTLSRYDDSLKREILAYAQEILQSADIGAKNIIKTLFSFFYKAPNWNERFKVINDSIRRLRKKVVVYIDDVDRLDKKEVVEVLRIVRNTGSFSNVFFIVAFDKTYVTAAINGVLISDSENYIEKIFQLEYYLPLVADSELLEWMLYKEIEAVLDDAGRARLHEMLVAEKTALSRETVPYLDGYLRSIRDVKRYMNVFLLNYDYIKENIYFPDYVGMCMLRLKYAEVFQMLYDEKNRYLTTYRKSGVMAEDTGMLSLVFESEDLSDLKNTLLYKELASNFRNYAINEKDVPRVATLVDSIFRNSNAGGLLSFRRTLENSHLSIVNVDCFDRYFDFSMEGRLDQKEFDTVLRGDLESLKRKIKEWNSIRTQASDLHVKFENANIASLDDLVSFEKLTRAIVYFANLTPTNNADEINKFNTENLYDKFVGKNREKGAVLKRFYNGDEGKYKRFIRELFYRSDDGGVISFMHDFAITLIKHYPDAFVLKHAELKTAIKDSFMAFASSSVVDFNSLWIWYNQVIREFLDVNKSTKYWVPVAEGIEMTEALRSLILKKGFNEYLNSLIFKQRPTSEYSLNYWIETFFGSRDDFEKELEQRKEDPVVAEFSEFYYKFKDNDHLPVNFNFKLLKPWGDLADEKVKYIE